MEPVPAVASESKVKPALLLMLVPLQPRELSVSKSFKPNAAAILCARRSSLAFPSAVWAEEEEGGRGEERRGPLGC